MQVVRAAGASDHDGWHVVKTPLATPAIDHRHVRGAAKIEFENCSHETTHRRATSRATRAGERFSSTSFRSARGNLDLEDLGVRS
jgi:hypothetical protein